VDNKSPVGVGGSLGAPEWKEGGIFELSRVVGKKLEEALGASLNGGGGAALPREERGSHACGSRGAGPGDSGGCRRWPMDLQQPLHGVGKGEEAAGGLSPVGTVWFQIYSKFQTSLNLIQS
jgi:hypothetical protein